MKYPRKGKLLLLALAGMMLLQGCDAASASTKPQAPADSGAAQSIFIKPTTEETQLEPGLSTVRYEGDSGLDHFLAQGGAASDAQVSAFLSGYLGGQAPALQTDGFACSTLAVPSPDGSALFGRNFDWAACDALIVQSTPATGYASVSTVNLDFLEGYLDRFPARARTLASLYAPLDGMNEKGLCVAVLMIQDSDAIDQDTGRPDLTTTTAVRLLLDKAADVEEALTLLEQYDLHASLGMMVHFALADVAGNSVAVEYVDNQMVVTETPIITNFYLAQGEKHGVGTAQSHTRYDILKSLLEQSPAMDAEQVRNAMDRVSKDNFGEFESTEWTVVYQQSAGQAQYYHRENYEKSYTVQAGKGEGI